MAAIMIRANPAILDPSKTNAEYEILPTRRILENATEIATPYNTSRRVNLLQSLMVPGCAISCRTEVIRMPCGGDIR
jgi:hypothetical protein